MMMRMRAKRTKARARLLPKAAACAAALVLSGCGSDLLVIGARQEPAKVELPSSAPRVAGAESAALREHQKMLQAFGGEYRAPALQAMLAGVVDKLRNASDLPGATYHVTILNSGLVNAFALPSGHLYVTRGLLALTNDVSEAAAVLAHEMAHVTARHAIERQELESRSVLVSRVRAEVLNNPGAAQLVRDQAQVAIASLSAARPTATRFSGKASSAIAVSVRASSCGLAASRRIAWLSSSSVHASG